MKLMSTSLALLVAACAAPTETQPSTSNRGPMVAANDPFPAAKSGLSLTGDKEQGLTLESVLSQFERVTGVHLVTTPDVEVMLAKTRAGVSVPLEVPANRVYPTVETLLVQNGLLLTLLTSEPPVMVGVEPADSGKVMKRTWFATADDLDIAADHPALLISTIVTLPNTNIRDLSNSMRQVFQDPRTQQIIPVGQSNSLMLSGRGSEVAALVRMLKVVDAEEGRAQAENAKRDARNPPVKRDEANPK
jgi:hypothetical protein